MITGIITGLVVALLLWWAYENDSLIPALICFELLGGIVSCNRSDSWQEYSAKFDAEQAAKARAEATPHVVREADGCKVYAFKADGMQHYFTRCPANTTTEQNYTVSCGKNKRCAKQETIVTEVK